MEGTSPLKLGPTYRDPLENGAIELQEVKIGFFADFANALSEISANAGGATEQANVALRMAKSNCQPTVLSFYPVLWNGSRTMAPERLVAIRKENRCLIDIGK